MALQRRAAGRRIREYFAVLLRARLCTGPQGDLLDLLCRADPAPTEERFRKMVAACMLVLVAGHETSTALMGNALLCLLEHPDLWNRLRAEPALVPAAVEEMIRLVGPVHALRRWTTRPVTALGPDIGTEAPVVVLVAAANRDPGRYAAPDTLGLDRSGEPAPLGFGWGNHFCLGARLARLETRVLLEEVLARPRPALAVPRHNVAPVPSLFVRGPAALPMLASENAR